MRIDLHTHSDRSDGTLTPRELVDAAATARLDVVALTDHDTAVGWDEAATAADEAGIGFVPGMEISCRHAGEGLHLLAYLLDPSHPQLVETLDRVLRARAERMPRICAALRSLGIDAFYAPLNDITSPAGKIAGAAQKRYASGAVLHHVTMAYDIDADAMLDVLRIGREKLSDKGTRSANKRVDPLRSQTGLPRAEIIDAFLAHFAARYDTRTGAITPAERAEAERLVEQKFATPQWLNRVP